MSRISRKEKLKQTRKEKSVFGFFNKKNKHEKNDEESNSTIEDKKFKDDDYEEKVEQESLNDYEDRYKNIIDNDYKKIYHDEVNGSMKTADRIISVEDEKEYYHRKLNNKNYQHSTSNSLMTVHDIMPADGKKYIESKKNSSSINIIDEDKIDDINKIKKINIAQAPFEDEVKVAESKKLAEKIKKNRDKLGEGTVSERKNESLTNTVNKKETLASKLEKELQEKENSNKSSENNKPQGLKKASLSSEKTSLDIVAKEDLNKKDNISKKETFAKKDKDSLEKTRVVKKAIGASGGATIAKEIEKKEEKPNENSKSSTDSDALKAEVNGTKKEETKIDGKEIDDKEIKNKEVSDGKVIEEKKYSGKFKKVLLAILGILVLIYVIGCIVFNFLFFPNTKVNGMEASFKTPDAINKMAKSRTNNYKIDINARNNVKDSIKGSDIDMKFIADQSAKNIKKQQGFLGWPIALFENENIDGKLNVKFDQSKLDKKIGQLNVLNKNNFKEPISAHPKYDEKKKKLVVDPGFDGSVALPEKVNAFVKESVKAQKLKTSVPDKAYKQKKNKADDPRIKTSINKLDKYTDMKVVYDFGYEKYTVGGTDILSMFDIAIEDDYKTELSKDKVREVVRKISRKYSTFGTTREIVGAEGNKIKVEGGDYGWLIDREAETDELYKIIESGKSVDNRKPIYSVKAYVEGKDDIGKEFIEIDLTKQHMWYVKDGKAIVSTPIVSGNPNTGAATPTGIYALSYKTRNAVLRGPGYASPVSYWMPFNGDIGIHDAYWQPVYGGSRYTYAGSHGCINTPFNAVAQIYKLSTEKMPVIVHD